jgi:D-amino-acid dehydrogenase
MASDLLDVDVAVVGGGVIGVAIAWRLARLGLGVTVIEQSRIGAGASLRNAGQIRAGEVTPLAAPGALSDTCRVLFERHAPVRVLAAPTPRMARWLWLFTRSSRQALEPRRQALAALGHLSQDLMADFARDHPELVNMAPAGALNVYETTAGLARAETDAEVTRAHGFACELLDRSSAQAIEPMLGDRIAGALFFPNDGHLDPRAYLSALWTDAEQAGARLVSGAAALKIEVSDRRAEAVLVGSRRVKARTIVLACGHATSQLTQPLGVNLPLATGKGYTVDVAGPGELSHPLVFVERHFAATPIRGAVRLAGGMIVGARTQTASVPRGATEALERRARELLPSLGTHRVDAPWAGLRPLTPDGLPVIGRIPRVPNLLIAAGHGMMGVTYSLGTAELIAALCRSSPAKQHVRPFSPERFQH